ncbi:GNAT family N-acetyltransferase [Chelatococcus reniformis]|uniref:N-acetyltransferase domain-containing protein n=1 Tax=Chelatococcus reniformis TaxID=1494448 RepID=A0A916TXN7_9HYPH|nr:GNAT family N-acetyltransferase [Chelatococcus reniformis]GGC51250.1 hypothetical protein GCM10010994_07970 [Chelatococcus reniformis]
MARTPPATGAIRKLFATDLPLFRDHLLRLDADSRRNRFIGGVSDEFIARYAARCFSRGAVVFGYIVDGEVRGAAELHPTDEGDSATAEAAFSVEPGLRRQGVGRELFAHLIRCARAYGVRHLRMNCLAHNRAMQALARKFKAELVLDRWETVAHLDAEAPTLFTLYNEAMNDAIDFTKAAISLQRRIWRTGRDEARPAA